MIKKSNSGKGRKVKGKNLASFDNLKPQLKSGERWVTVNGKHMIVRDDKKRN